MTPPAGAAPPGTAPRSSAPAPSWSDVRLVAACRNGDERAWGALIDKYKRLIFSICLKYGARAEDAADIFQSVCLELFSGLDDLRRSESIKAWLVRVTLHRCYHWKKQERAHGAVGLEELPEEPEDPTTGARAILEEVEKEQTVREVVQRLPARCAEMVRLLFYEDPPLPYAEVARRLGLATGSIGFIRGRCLKRLQKTLHELGF